MEHKMKRTTLPTSFLTFASFVAPGVLAADSSPGSTASLNATYVAAPYSLAAMNNPACSKATLKRASRNGLKFADLASIGSGLAKAGENEFYGITDRGPNGKVEDDDDGDERRTFPLPELCPTILRFKISGKEMQITQCIPFKDSRGKLVSGLSNLPGDERLYESANANSPLPLDVNGIDPEGIRVLPDGRFLVCEEYGPSLLLVGAQGEVLARYVPESKPLPGASYPVKPILPAVFAQRRPNHGFESIAVSSDGRTVYAILQSPMGEEDKKRFRDSRVVRALKLDLSNPLEARVAGEYLVLTSDARSYSAKQKQDQIYFSDAEWVAPDKLLVIERGKNLGKMLLLDFHAATDVVARSDASTLLFEDVKTDLAALRINPARVTELFSTRGMRGITSDKLEGLARVGSDEVALINDNDFGLGNNSGERSRLWTIRVPALAAFLQ
jgi:alkaline phosphatase